MDISECPPKLSAFASEPLPKDSDSELVGKAEVFVRFAKKTSTQVEYSVPTLGLSKPVSGWRFETAHPSS